MRIFSSRMLRTGSVPGRRLARIGYAHGLSEQALRVLLSAVRHGRIRTTSDTVWKRSNPACGSSKLREHLLRKDFFLLLYGLVGKSVDSDLESEVTLPHTQACTEARSR